MVMLGWLMLGAAAHAAPPAHHHRQDNGLLYHWKEVRDKDGGITLLSTYPAPVPFSMTGQPEAMLTVGGEGITPGKDTLNDIVTDQIRRIRKEAVLAEYMEQDGRKPDHGIATWIETIAGTRVAFIKYRAQGLVGQPPSLPKTVIETYFIKANRVVCTMLIVRYARHQDEDRRDQRRIVRMMIETAPKRHAE